MDFVRILFVVFFFFFFFFFKSLGLMYLTSDGRDICTTAQRFYRRRREFSIAAENLMRLT